MKIIIRYLEIYIYIQDLRIYDIIKNSITTTANRIFILNKSYGNRTFCTNLHSQKFNVSALILSVSVFKLSTFETSRPMVFCSSLAFKYHYFFLVYTFQTYEHPIEFCTTQILVLHFLFVLKIPLRSILRQNVSPRTHV